MKDPLEQIRTGSQLVYNPVELAAILHKDPRTVRKACQSGQIPCFRVGRSVLISRETVLHLLSGQAA